MSIAPTLGKLPVKSVTEVLEHLNRVRTQGLARGESRESLQLPIVTLMLHTGALMRGEILAYGNERHQGATLMLQTNVGASAADVSYIPLAAISGITLHVSRDNVHLLAFGELNPQAPNGKGPGRLEVERQIAEWSQSLAKSVGVEVGFDVAWDAVPAHDQARFTLFEMLKALQGAVAELAGDGLGRDVLKEHGRKIRVVAGSEPGIARQDGALTVTFTVDGDDLKVVRPASMRASLEKAL
jgi:hypothetical protein